MRISARNGSLSTVRGLPPDQVNHHGVASSLPELWLSLHDAVADVVDRTTLADLLPVRYRTSA